jgi:hypothetical protein
MAEQMTTSELAAVSARIAARGPGAPHVAPTHEDIAASLLTGYIAAGDSGAARRLLHEVEHGLGIWRLDPWWLLERVVDLAIRRQKASASPEPAPAAEARVAQPDTTAPAPPPP